MIQARRVYGQPRPSDGFRVLVDRLWPRGLSKSAAQVDLWMREIAPSAELRAWFAHDPEKRAEFTERYRAELASNRGLVDGLLARTKGGNLTLLFAARDETCNNATVLLEYLKEVRHR